MNRIYVLVLYSFITLSVNAQDSILRPRVQLAQLKAEVEDLLDVANVENLAQVKRTIRDLQTKLNSAHAENKQLKERLEIQKQELTLAQQQNKQLNQSLKKLKVFKAKSSSHFEALRTLIDTVPEDTP